MATTTSTITSQQAHDAVTKFTYLEWHSHYDTEKPFQALEIPDDAVDKREGNVSFKEGGEEVVHDVSGREEAFTLDNHGRYPIPGLVIVYRSGGWGSKLYCTRG